MGRPVVKKSEHAAALPSLEYIRALRELGAHRVITPAIEIDFEDKRDRAVPGIESAAAIAHRLEHEAQRAVKNADLARKYVRDVDIPGRVALDDDEDVADTEVNEEERARRAKEDYQATLLASAD